MTYVLSDSASPTRMSSFFSQTLDRVTLPPLCWNTLGFTDCTKSFISSSSTFSSSSSFLPTSGLFFYPFWMRKKKTTHSALVEKFMKWLAHSTLQTRPTFCLLTSKVPLFPLTYLIVFLSLSLSLTSNGSCPQFKGFNTLSPTSTPFFSPLLLEMAKDTVTHTLLCLIICQICHNKNTLNTSVEYFIQNWNSLQVNLLKGWIRCFYFFYIIIYGFYSNKKLPWNYYVDFF